MAPLTLTKVSSIPDILSSNRCSLLFDPIPGLTDLNLGEGSGEEGLLIKKAEVNIPGFQIGHVRYPVLGYGMAVAGASIDHQNIFSATFFEDSYGYTIKTLLGWMRYIRGFEDRNGAKKSEYAITCNIIFYDTMGLVAYALEAQRTWIAQLTPSPSTAETAPAIHQAQFSMDFLDLSERNFDDLEENEDGTQPAPVNGS